jgi:hypothetical protein
MIAGAEISKTDSSSLQRIKIKPTGIIVDDIFVEESNIIVKNV